MATPKDIKRLKKLDNDPARGLKRDTRRDKRKRFGLKITMQDMYLGNLGKAYVYTKWYKTAQQRDEALRTEKTKGEHGWSTKEIRKFEIVER